MSLSNSVTQGGQTFLHRLRMYAQIFRLATVISFGLFIFCFAVLTYSFIPKKAWHSFYSYKKKQLNAYISGTTAQIPKNPTIQNHNRLFQVKVKECFYLSLCVGVLTYCMLLLIWQRKGRKDKESMHISGTMIETPKEVVKLMHKNSDCSAICLGSIPMVKNSETQHMLITGTTGSGKTNCFHHLLKQIRNQKAVILDTTGEFVERYYDASKDIILNPFDTRSKGWHMWAECFEDYHYNELAENIISSTTHDEFWQSAARTVFVAALKIAKNHSVKEFLALLNQVPLGLLHKKLIDTEASALVDPTSEKTAASIRMNLCASIQCLNYLHDTNEPFSIRKWMQVDNQNGWLFLSTKPEQRAAIRPLLSAWASIAIKGLMGCVPSLSRRVWIILDELPALHKLPALTLCLSEGRKCGACIVLGLQNLPQIEAIYGEYLSKSIVDLCSTKALFRCASYDVALKMSQMLGEKEMLEISEGISYGANDMRDGVNLNMHNRMRSTVSANDLVQLNDLESYIKLPKNYPIVKMQWDIV